MNGELFHLYTDPCNWLLIVSGTKNGKRVQANLAAKNHAVIMPDGKLIFISTYWYWRSIWLANKNLALKPSQFIPLILKPVRDFFGINTVEGVGKSLRNDSAKEIATQVFDVVASRWYCIPKNLTLVANRPSPVPPDMLATSMGWKRWRILYVAWRKDNGRAFPCSAELTWTKPTTETKSGSAIN